MKAMESLKGGWKEKGKERPEQEHSGRDLDGSSHTPSLQPTSSQVSGNNDRPLSRSGTLSWQQRPGSRGGLSSRPLSVVAAENNASRSARGTPEPVSNQEVLPSRSEISQSLELKDPTWFKQTAERGLGSAAFRRNRETTSETDRSGESVPLPGLSSHMLSDPSKDVLRGSKDIKSVAKEASVNAGTISSMPSSSLQLDQSNHWISAAIKCLRNVLNRQSPIFQSQALRTADHLALQPCHHLRAGFRQRDSRDHLHQPKALADSFKAP